MKTKPIKPSEARPPAAPNPWPLLGCLTVAVILASLPMGWLAFQIDRWRHRAVAPGVHQSDVAKESLDVVVIDPALFFVDLQPSANKEMGISDLPKFPEGVRQWGNSQFRIGPGYLQLGSKLLPEQPRKLTGIPVGNAFDKLHVLHATKWGGQLYRDGLGVLEEGMVVGEYVLHYEDGQTQVLPIVYGEDVRDWWNWDRSKPTKNAVAAWNGKHPEASRYGVGVRLFVNQWDNPRPDQKVVSIDFISTDTAAAPFCVAMTAHKR